MTTVIETIAAKPASDRKKWIVTIVSFAIPFVIGLYVPFKFPNFLSTEVTGIPQVLAAEFFLILIFSLILNIVIWRKWKALVPPLLGIMLGLFIYCLAWTGFFIVQKIPMDDHPSQSTTTDIPDDEGVIYVP